MKAQKKRNKKYNPNKVRNELMKMRANKCALYRWGHGPDDFHAFGPKTMDPAQVEQCMGWACAMPNRWAVVVYACFAASKTDYYEEMHSFFTDTIVIGKEGPQDDIEDLINQATTMAKGEGNLLHFVDTCTVVRLLSPSFKFQLEDDAWLKKQAAWRASQILGSLEAA